MSEGFTLAIGDENPSSYTVRTIEGCKVIFGNVPIDDFQGLAAMVGDDGFMDSSLANLMGATFVLGTKENLARLRQTDLPISKEREMDARRARSLGLRETLIEWLRTGDRGKSSNAICKQIYGFPELANNDHPHDVGDLSRCILFLDAACDPVERKSAIERMAALSPEWGRLVEAWDDLESSFLKEEGNRKPVTAAKMRALLD